MDGNQLATKGDITAAKEELIQAFHKLVEPDLAKLNGHYITVEEIAAFNKYDKRTVGSWITEEKKDQFGKRVKLVADEFCPGKYRAMKSEGIAYGKIKWHIEISHQRKTS
ncbi:hypothetical protein [Rufibacter latericius]|uniref:Uncharacterized protein n=1 Tax=Rufibacter latericius TaxID=2487040 RepID=A0A3M9M9Y9_9BACT|nr:hypothetical protein [Rufibacter latericius]RNI22025.1 hypothetical protein EFB08_23110 [Rufibacter latericius]